MTDSPNFADDPWSSSSSDSPDRSGARLGELKQRLATPRKRYTAVFVLMILLIMLADQLSKAWFVYRLATHSAGSFAGFLSGYFSLFAGFSGEAQLVRSHYIHGPQVPEPVFGEWLRWLLTTNTGAAWSMFAGNSLALSAVSIIIATLLFFFWRASFRSNFLMSLACGAIIGGALGNFIDRFRLHEVVDFISVRIPLIGKLIPALGDPYDFPIFNVADASAVCGTIGLAIYLVAIDIAASRRKHARQAARKRLRAMNAAAGAAGGTSLATAPEPPPAGSAADDDGSAAGSAASGSTAENAASSGFHLPPPSPEAPSGVTDEPDEPAAATHDAVV